MSTKSLSLRLLNLAKKKRRKIGISILKTTPEIITSLRKANKIAEVVVYGKKILGLKNVPGSGMKIGIKMIQDFKKGFIVQLVRGQVDDFAMVNEAKKLFNITSKKRRVDIGLLRDIYGHEFFITGASNPDFQNLEEKKYFAKESAKWMKNTFGITPKIAVMATCRPGSYGKDKEMTKTYDEAEALVKYLRDLGYQAKNIHIEIEKAVEFCNLLLPARGTIGNQIFRALVYLGKGQNLACPTLFPGKLIYADNSRNEIDWYPHIVFAAALANMKNM